MVERYLRQSPLAHLGLGVHARDDGEAAGLRLAERPFPGVVSLRGPQADKDFRAAFEAAAGYALPEAAGATNGSENTTAFWLAPDEWWIVDGRGDPDSGVRIAETLQAALKELPVAVTDISESRACLRVSGPKARTTLQKACPLDLHPKAFQQGQCAHTRLAKASALIHRVADDSATEGPVFDVYVVRSFAEYTWLWLQDAGREYGVAVIRA